jgi:hypothetical protein
MLDILEIIKNVETIYSTNSSLGVLKDFERVLDEMDMYVYKNWEDGELISGPKVNRYDVECKFMWPKEMMPDPQGGKRLVDYGCNVVYQKDEVLMPRKIKEPDDFRPGTKKGKIDAHPIWIVTITMPKKLMQDVYVGKENKENNRMAELMKYSTQEVTPETAAQEAPEDELPPTA